MKGGMDVGGFCSAIGCMTLMVIAVVILWGLLYFAGYLS